MNKKILLYITFIILLLIVISSTIKMNKENNFSVIDNEMRDISGEVVLNESTHTYTVYDKEGINVKELKEDDTTYDLYKENSYFNPDPTE